jgi:hypothetical protein
MQRIFLKKCFLFTAGSVCHIKWFSFGGNCVTNDEEAKTEMWKWLRQQSKDYYSASFDALVKCWAKCINIDEGMLRTKCFFQV